MRPSELNTTMIRFCATRLLDSDTSWQPDGYAFLLVLDGALALQSADPDLCGSDTLYIIPDRQKVILKPQNNASVFFLVLRAETMLACTGTEEIFHVTTRLLPETRRQEIRLTLRQLREEVSAASDPEDHAQSFFLSSDLFRLLGLLSDPAEQKSSGRLETDNVPPAISSSTGLFDGISSYMKKNYNAGPGQADTAARFHISPQYLARLIRQHTGLTFRGYLKQIQDEAFRLYRKHTDLTDEQILQLTSPDRFRSSADAFPSTNKSYPLPGRAVSESSISPAASPACDIENSCASALIRVPAQSGRPMPESWKCLINLGYASALRNLRIEDTLSAMQNTIGFRYGRICRIFDVALRFQIADRSIRDYSQAFSILDILMKNQMIPFLELGNKSFAIQKNSSASFYPEGNTDSRTYFKELLEVLPDFIGTCINRYGQEYFDTWRFEVSYSYTANEKNPFSFIQYLRVFRRIQKIIRRYSTKARIGGPGFNRWDKPGQIQRALDQMKAEQSIPDFMTIYLYPMEKEPDGILSILEDPGVLIRRLQSFVDASRFAFPEKQIWVTEFNSNLSSRNYLNDSVYQAVYLSRILTAVSALPVSAMGYYLLSDAPLRYSDSLEFLFGGWGLYTDTGLPKASCNTYRLFRMTGRYLVQTGPGYLITANSESSFQILLTHYRHMKTAYRRHNVPAQALPDPEQVFLPTPDLNYTILLPPVPSGTYLLRKYTIDSSHANLFHEWQKSGFLPQLQPGLLEDFRSLSQPVPEINRITILPGQPLELHIRLDRMQVCLYSVQLYSSRTDLTISDFDEKGESQHEF